METRIGIKPDAMAEAAHSLNTLLADEHVLYIKTRNAHWNVEGSDFHAMHLFFEKQYGELEEMIDEVAERIRMIGHFAVGSMKEFLELTHLSEKSSGANTSKSFIKELLEDHQAIISHVRGEIKRNDEDYNDQGTSDFITGLMEKHEKMAWMLRAHLR